MYVILTQDVPQVGSKNALVSVSDGYYMNYLSPRKLATQATSAMIDSLKDVIVAQRDAGEQATKSDEQHAQTLQTAQLVLKGKASGKGTLFKALVEKDVVAAIKKQFKFEVDPSQITMDHLKKVGEHIVSVQLGKRKIDVKVLIESES